MNKFRQTEFVPRAQKNLTTILSYLEWSPAAFTLLADQVATTYVQDVLFSL